jgi:hyperosmotically inducible periplasmic protein
MRKTYINGIFLALLACSAVTSPAQVKQDNTEVNKRDRNPGEVTADQQKETAADRDLAAKIRREITKDKSLSTYGHNVKIIVQNGVVTLKGPVRSDAEIQTITATASRIAGGDAKVTNQLTVEPSKP